MRFPVALALLSAVPFSEIQEAAPRVLEEGRLPNDARLGPLKDFNGDFPFEVPATQAAWEARAAALRRRVQVAAGLWPWPERTPLHARVFGRTERSDFTVEKVVFESFPGHYVTGLLFRPRGKRGPFPAVLSPHGHEGRLWDYGERIRNMIVEGAERFERSGRMPQLARCATLARLGCVTFIHDMLGYADSVQIPAAVAHRFSKPRPWLHAPERWGFYSPQAELRLQNILGLQAWNCLRALDFLAERPDVDASRIGVTGSSGGGTQTILIGALDPRPAVAFPQGMVSTSMQGGCTCENAPYLRIGTGNVELAALFAPKPLAMTAANDWTREMMTKGYPELQKLYERLGAKDRVFCKNLVHFPHNYNYVTRAVMYSWFNRHLRLGHKDPIVEEDFEPLTPAAYTVWDAEHPKPESGEDLEVTLLRALAEASDRQMAALEPRDADSLAKYRDIVGGALDVLVGRRLPAAGDVVRRNVDREDRGDFWLSKDLWRHSGEEIPAVSFHPKSKEWNGKVVVWVDGAGKSALFRSAGAPRAEVRRLLDAGFAVVGADLLYQGEFLPDGKPLAEQPVVPSPREFAGFTFGYNAPLFAKRVHDVLTVVSGIVHDERSPREVTLWGTGGAGPIAAVARAQAGPAVTRAFVDTQGFRFSRLASYRHPDFLPGALKYGDLPAFLALGAPGELWLAGEGETPPPVVAAAYAASGKPQALRLFAGAPDRALAAAIAALAAVQLSGPADPQLVVLAHEPEALVENRLGFLVLLLALGNDPVEKAPLLRLKGIHAPLQFLLPSPGRLDLLLQPLKFVLGLQEKHHSHEQIHSRTSDPFTFPPPRSRRRSRRSRRTGRFSLPWMDRRRRPGVILSLHRAPSGVSRANALPTPKGALPPALERPPLGPRIRSPPSLKRRLFGPPPGFFRTLSTSGRLSPPGPRFAPLLVCKESMHGPRTGKTRRRSVPGLPGDPARAGPIRHRPLLRRPAHPGGGRPPARNRTRSASGGPDAGNGGGVIGKDDLVPDVLRRYPGTRRVFDEAGLHGCGGPSGPRETVEFFARVHGVPLDRFLRDLDAARETPAPPAYREDPLDNLYARFFRGAIAVVLTAGATLGAGLLLVYGWRGSFTSLDLLPYVQAHGNAQVYGWVGLFVMGFAYQALPRFRYARLGRPRLAALSFLLMLGGLVLRQTAALPWAGAVAAGLAGSVLEALAALLFATVVLKTLAAGRDREPWEAYVRVATLCFALSALAEPALFGLAALAPSTDALIARVATWNRPHRDLQILGFAGFMILGVGQRILPTAFGFRAVGKTLSRTAFVLLSAGLLTDLSAWLTFRATGHRGWGMAAWAGSVLYALGATALALGIRGFTGGDGGRSTKFIRAAFLWLAAASAMMIAEPFHAAALGIRFSHAFHGAIRHAFTVGFISIMILGVSAKVVPILKGMDLRALPGLWAPFVLLNAGNALRVGSQVATDFHPAAFAPMAISGLLEVAALALWGGHLWRLLSRPSADSAAPEPPRPEPDQRVTPLLDAHPELLEIFEAFGFKELRNPLLRNTLARRVTLRAACTLKGVDESAFLAALRARLAAQTPVGVDTRLGSE